MGELRDEISNEGFRILSSQVVNSIRSFCITNEILSISIIRLSGHLLGETNERKKGAVNPNSARTCSSKSVLAVGRH